MFWELTLQFGPGLRNTPENLSIFNTEEQVGKKPTEKTASQQKENRH